MQSEALCSSLHSRCPLSSTSGKEEWDKWQETKLEMHERCSYICYIQLRDWGIRGDGLQCDESANKSCFFKCLLMFVWTLWQADSSEKQNLFEKWRLSADDRALKKIPQSHLFCDDMWRTNKSPSVCTGSWNTVEPKVSQQVWHRTLSIKVAEKIILCRSN